MMYYNTMNNCHHHGPFRRLPVPLVTAVPHRCPLCPHGTFTTPSLSSIIQNFTIFLAATFAMYVFILFPHRYHHVTCLIRSPITRSVWHIRYTPSSSHSYVILPPSKPYYSIRGLVRISNQNIHIHSSHLSTLLLVFTVSSPIYILVHGTLSLSTAGPDLPSVLSIHWPSRTMVIVSFPFLYETTSFSSIYLCSNRYSPLRRWWYPRVPP